MNELIITTVVGLVIAIISFFLKQTIGRVNKNSEELGDIRQNYVKRDELDKQFGKLSRDVEKIRDNYITKDDFVRELSGLDRKLTQLLNLHLKGGDNGG
ncbi:hypothetical protein FACS189425_03540 [Clostridia bacterium]|nr:hypothetical protein FACS189425_03540 [Clostridia bacterium]